MKEVALPVLEELGLGLAEQDVRDDPALALRYRFEIPVLLWGGQEVERHRTTAEGLRERLRTMGAARPSE